MITTQAVLTGQVEPLEPLDATKRAALSSAERQARRRAQFNTMRAALKAIRQATSLRQAKTLAEAALAA